MNRIRLENDGALWLKERPLTRDALACLGTPLALSPACTLRSFFRLLESMPVLQRLNPFAPSYLERFRRAPSQDCIIAGIEALQLRRTIEMTGWPGAPSIRIFVSLEGLGPADTQSIKEAGLEHLLDVPLRLGRLKHTIFGDRVDSLEFDTVFNLFEFIDGICWELSFHNLPDQCRIDGG